MTTVLADSPKTWKGNMNENAHSTTIHILLQRKGGVGKSLIASFLTQYFTSRGHAVRCIDADPVNCTFSQYGRLNVQRLRVLPNGGIDAAFDALMETLFKDHGTFVIDSGATTFIPLWNRLSQRDVIAALNNVNRPPLYSLHHYRLRSRRHRRRSSSDRGRDVYGKHNSLGQRILRSCRFPRKGDKQGTAGTGCRISRSSKTQSGHIRPRHRRHARQEADLRRGHRVE